MVISEVKEAQRRTPSMLPALQHNSTLTTAATHRQHLVTQELVVTTSVTQHLLNRLPSDANKYTG